MTEDPRDETKVTPIPELDKKEKHAYIVFLTGPLVGKIHLLEEGVVRLGRADDTDIPINDPGISRHHLQFEHKRGRTRIQDLGSTNGTFLNGQRLGKETELKDGDKIQVSSSTIIKFAYQDKIENIFHTELYRMAVVDALTGAHNKRYLQERLREEFAYSKRNRVPISFLMIDLDHFKEINDTYGHPAGDFVLERIVSLARSVIRSEDILARYGGEEFAIVLKSTAAEGARMIAERLRNLVAGYDFEFERNKIRLTISIGISTLQGDNLADPEAMIQEADKFLYQSKAAGRNRVSP